MGVFSRLSRAWNNVCYRIGTTVATYPVITILLCLILTIFLSWEVVVTKQQSAMDGYASENARSRYEFQVFQQFLDSDGPGITLGLLVQAKDNGSMLREDYLNETIRISDFVATNFKMTTSGRQQSFNEFCRGFCLANEPVVQYYNGLQILNANDSDTASQRIDLSYPTSSFFGREFSLIPNFFGIELKEDGKTLNSSSLIVLYYRAERYSDWTKESVKNWELAVRDYFVENYKGILDINVMSSTVVESEIVRAGMSLQPFLIVGFIIMALFCTATTMASAVLFYKQRPSFHKVALAVIACINPFMACGTALGFLFLCGIPFSPILCITPFLVLAISVDDSFLMLHAWNRLEASRKEPMDSKKRIDHMGEVLMETGPAITISALTNILAFSVGSFNSPPEIKIFCYGNAAAIFMDMFYQATFYTACMAQLADEKHINHNEKIFNLQEKLKRSLQKLLRSYIDFISNIYVAVTILLLWMFFIGIAAYGLSTFTVKLTPSKFFLRDSPMIKMDQVRSHEVLPYFTPVTVIVNQPGDLSNQSVTDGMISLKNKLETLPYAIGEDSTKFFINDYLQFRESSADPEEEFEAEEADLNSTKPSDDLETFLDWPEFSFWKGFMRFEKNSTKITKYFFSTGYHGEKLKDWDERGNLLDKWREIIDEFKELFNATVFTEDAFFLDLLDTLPTIAWQTTLATFFCVSLVCFLFIADFFTVFIVSVSVLVTCVGVFGTLSLFGVSLDPVVMSIAIMCIGFSIDIPAHVSSHFYAARSKLNSTSIHDNNAVVQVEDAPTKRTLLTSVEDIAYRESLAYTLSSVGFPVIQAGISTNFCALPLAFLQLYMAKIFAVSLALCVSLSLLHGLLIIPASLSIHNKFCKIRSKTRNS